jgi:hypothetical protein
MSPELADPGRRGPPIARPGKVVGIGKVFATGLGAQRTPFAAHAAP